MRTLAAASVLAFAFAAGCYSSQDGDDDGHSDDSPDATDGHADQTDSADAHDAPEAGEDGGTDDGALPDGAECATDDDCVVVLHQDRCCNPDAVAGSCPATT